MLNFISVYEILMIPNFSYQTQIFKHISGTSLSSESNSCCELQLSKQIKLYQFL